MARERAVGSGNGQLCRIEQAGERQRARSEIIFGESGRTLLSVAQRRATALARAEEMLGYHRIRHGEIRGAEGEDTTTRAALTISRSLACLS